MCNGGYQDANVRLEMPSFSLLSRISRLVYTRECVESCSICVVWIPTAQPIGTCEVYGSLSSLMLIIDELLSLPRQETWEA